MNQRIGEFTQAIHGLAERLMGCDEQHRIAVLLGQAQELIAQIAGRPERVLATVEVPQSPDRREQMGRFAHSHLKLQFPVEQTAWDRGACARAPDLWSDERSPLDWPSAHSPAARRYASSLLPGRADPPMCSAGRAARAGWQLSLETAPRAPGRCGHGAARVWI